MTQELSLAGAAFVRALEGVVLRYYLDASTPPVGTIGEGFTWKSRAFREWWQKNKPGMRFGRGATMTRAECDAALIYLFRHEYGKAVCDFLGGDVPQHVFDGMCSPVYNLGPGSLRWKWAAAAKAGDYALSGARLQNTGRTAGGKQLQGLINRRKEEAELIEKGDYAIGGTLGTADAMADGVLVKGERGAAVMDMQRRLEAIGFYHGVVDGLFGHGTEAAVIEFQRAKRLHVDGWAGRETLKAISAAHRPANTPKSTPAPNAPKTLNPAPTAPKTGWAALFAAIVALFSKLKRK